MKDNLPRILVRAPKRCDGGAHEDSDGGGASIEDIVESRIYGMGELNCGRLFHRRLSSQGPEGVVQVLVDLLQSLSSFIPPSCQALPTDTEVTVKSSLALRFVNSH